MLGFIEKPVILFEQKLKHPILLHICMQTEEICVLLLLAVLDQMQMGCQPVRMLCSILELREQLVKVSAHQGNL